MRKRILSALVAIGLVFGIGGYTLTHASASPAPAAVFAGGVPGALVFIDPASPRGNYLDANGVPHCLPSGPNSTVLWATGDYPKMSWHGANPSCTFAATGTASLTAPAVSPVKIVHKQVTINADFEASSVADRTVTITGLPAFRSTSSPFEVYGSTAADVNIPATATVPAADITVTPVGGPTGTSTVGATERKFVVTPHNFVGTRTYTLDIWVLTLVA